MNYIKLENIKNNVEKMSIINQIEIAILLINHKGINMNENKNGFYINLSFLDDCILDQIEQFITEKKTMIL